MDSSDYEVYDRKNGSSIKYQLALKYRQPTVNPENAIVVSHADMQFKFSPQIFAKLVSNLGEPHFGYSRATQPKWKALQNWIQSRYLPSVSVSRQNTLLWNNMLELYNCVVELTTEPGDNILFFSPTYYRFLVQAQFLKRNCIDVQLKTKEKTFEIDFEELEEKLKNNDIKLVVFVSPHNPCGHIWSYNELERIKDLVLKYKCRIFSDQIYSDWIQPAKEEQTVLNTFTSMLRFQDLHPYLIYANSYTKTWNCSGMSLTYAMTFDEDLQKKLRTYLDLKMIAFPNAVSLTLMETLYTSEEAKQWKLNTRKYIQNNFNLFKELCAEKLPKLFIYDLECSYLVLTDFHEYGMKGKEIQDAFSSIDVCPTFTAEFFIEQKPRSMVRINIACNIEVIKELVDRMQKMVLAHEQKVKNEEKQNS